MKNKWTTGKVVGLVFGIIGAAIVLLVAFVFSLYQLIEKIIEIDSIMSAQEYDRGTDQYYEDDFFDVEQWNQEEYYEFQDAIREDLQYSISFESFQYTCGKGHNVNAEIEYPVVSGDVPNLDGINAAIQQELTVIESYVDSWADLEEDSEYSFLGTTYVTYMSESILSIVYVESGNIDGENYENYVVCVNIDMETGMPMSNTQLMNIDDSFSIEFRKRCEKQNGDIDSLSDLSDQEITEYLTDPDYMIIFYTPMGMEVGMNYPGGWVTVTYTDYKEFQSHI